MPMRLMLTEPQPEPEPEPPSLPQEVQVQEALTAMPLTATTAIPSSSRTLP